MDDGGRCLLDVINDPLLLQSFLECSTDNFPKGHHHNGDTSLSAAAAAGGTLLIGHHHNHETTGVTSSPGGTTLLSLASLKPSLESMGFNCQTTDKQSLMGHITVTSAVGTTSVISSSSPLPAVYPLSRQQQQLYSIKSPSQGSSPAQTMPPPSPLQSPGGTTPNRNTSPTVVLQTPHQTMQQPKVQQSQQHYPIQHNQQSAATIIPLSVQQQLSSRLSALSGHVVPTTSGMVQIISTSPHQHHHHHHHSQPPPVVRQPQQASSVRPIQPKQILPKPPKSAQMAKQVAPNHPLTSPTPQHQQRAAAAATQLGVSLNAASANSPMVIGQGQPGVFTGPQGTIVLNQFLPGMGHGPFVIQGNIGNMQGVQLTLRPTQPGHYTTGPPAGPQGNPGGTHGSNATLIAALQAPAQHHAPILGQPKANPMPGHHTIVFPGALTGQNINLTTHQGSVIHSAHPNQGILTQRPNIFLAPRMLGTANHALQLQQIQTPQGPITIALAPSHTLSLQQLASLQGAQIGGHQLTSVQGMMGQGVFSNVATLRHPQTSPVPCHSPFAPKPIQEPTPPPPPQPQQISIRPMQQKATTPPCQPQLVASTPTETKEEGSNKKQQNTSVATMKPSLNLAELLKEHGIVPETTPPPSPTNNVHFVSSEQAADSAEVVEAATLSARDSRPSPREGTSQSQVATISSTEKLDPQPISSPVIQQPTVSSSVQDHPTLLSRLTSAPVATDVSPSLVLGAPAVRTTTPPECQPQQHLIIRNALQPHLLNLPSTLTVCSDSSPAQPITSFAPSARLNHVLVSTDGGATAMVVQQQQFQDHLHHHHPVYGSNGVPTSKLVPASLVSASPVLVKTSENSPCSQGFPQSVAHANASVSSSSTCITSTSSDFHGNSDAAKHQQALLVQLRQGPSIANHPFSTTVASRTIALQAVEKPSDNCKFNQDINKTRQPGSNFINVVNRPHVLHHLGADHSNVLRPDANTPFSSCQDACTRLLRYHVYNSQVPSQDDLRKTDELFEVVSQRLLERRQRMINKYRYLLLKESMKSSPSSENVMLERMFIQEEIPSLKLYKKMVSEAKDVEVSPAPSATLTKDVSLPEEPEIIGREDAPPSSPIVVPASCECRGHSLKRDRTRNSQDDGEAEPSCKKTNVVSVVVKSPDDLVVSEGTRDIPEVRNNVGLNHVAVREDDDHEDIVSKIRKELNISPIDHQSDDEDDAGNYDAHSGNLDFFEPPVTRSNSSCGSPFPAYNSKSNSASLRYDFDVMDGQSEWYSPDQKLFMDAADVHVDNLFPDHHGKVADSAADRTFAGFRIAGAKSGNALKINCLRSLVEDGGVNGEFLGSLDEDSDDDDSNEVQVQTAIKSILSIDGSSVDNHAYYADGELVSHVFDEAERQVKILQDSRDFDESLNPDNLSGNSLESDAALDEAVRSILL